MFTKLRQLHTQTYRSETGSLCNNRASNRRIMITSNAINNLEHGQGDLNGGTQSVRWYNSLSYNSCAAIGAHDVHHVPPKGNDPDNMKMILINWSKWVIMDRPYDIAQLLAACKPCHTATRIACSISFYVS